MTATTPAMEVTADPANAWVRFGYDLRNTFFNPAEKTISVANAPMLKELWRFKVAGYPPGSPTVVDGKVYLMSTGGLYAIDLDTGVQIWTRDDVIGTSTIAYDNGFLYIHAQGTTRAVGEIIKLNASDGTTVWGPTITYDLENCEAFSSAQVAKGNVFVGHSCGARELALDGTNRGPRGGVAVFDAETGMRKYTYWSVPEGGEDGAMSWSTVALEPEEGAVYASTGNNYTVGGPNSDAIHKFNFDTGERIWTTQVTMGDIWGLAMGNVGDEDFGASPILADVGGKQLVAAGDKGARFWALDRATGEILWSRKMLTPSRGPANGGVLNNGGFDGKGFIFISNDPDANKSKVYKVDPLTGEDIWVKDYANMAWGMPSMANGIAVIPINADLYILNADTGEELTKFSTGGTIAGGAAAIAQGKIVVKSGLSYPLSADVLNSDQVICYGLPSAAGAPAAMPAGMPPMAAQGSPAWSAIFRDIIVAKGCQGASLCHGGQAGKLMMTTRQAAYDNLVGKAAMGMSVAGPSCVDSGLTRIVPGDPDKSLLMQKVRGTHTCGDLMPPNPPMLTQAELEQIQMWIMLGAPND